MVAGETGLYVPLSGQLIIGGVVSFTSTLNEHVADFPTLSVTLHVTAVVPRPNHVPLEIVHAVSVALMPDPSLAVRLQL